MVAVHCNHNFNEHNVYIPLTQQGCGSFQTLSYNQDIEHNFYLIPRSFNRLCCRYVGRIAITYHRNAASFRSLYYTNNCDCCQLRVHRTPNIKSAAINRAKESLPLGFASVAFHLEAPKITQSETFAITTSPKLRDIKGVILGCVGKPLYPTHESNLCGMYANRYKGTK